MRSGAVDLWIVKRNKWLFLVFDFLLSENEDGWSFLCGGFDNRLDNRRQTVIVECSFDQTSWYHACKYHATSPGIINFTFAALAPQISRQLTLPDALFAHPILVHAILVFTPY